MRLDLVQPRGGLGRGGLACQSRAARAQPLVSVDPLSPFGRASKAPLAGRTILQIVPPRAAGGDERSTLAVAAALVAAGARALVATEAGELPSEVQAVGGLHVPFPASSKNPLAMALNARRLARILDSERVDLVHARSRAAAWVALVACRKPKTPLVTTILGEGPGDKPRSSFEAAVGEGDFVVASSQFAADRAGEIFPDAVRRLRIVRPGLDLAQFAPDAVSRQRVAKIREGWGVAPHERIVLAPAPLAPSRGQKLLIEAAALLTQKGLADIRFVFAGEAAKPSLAREFDAFAARGVNDRHLGWTADRSPGRVRRRERRRIRRRRSGGCRADRDPGRGRGGADRGRRCRPRAGDRARAAAGAGGAANRVDRFAGRRGGVRRRDRIGFDPRRVGAGCDPSAVARADRRALFARAHAGRYAARLRRGAADEGVLMVSRGYSARQIALHWIAFVLVAFEWFAGDHMTELFKAAHEGRPTEVASVWAPVHIAVGVTILVVMLWRLVLRRADGTPPPPKQHPALEWLASAVHVGLYLDLIGAALIGLVADFWLPQLTELHHLMVRPILLALFALHLIGALWHRFVVRDDVMTRIVRPAQ